MIAAWRTALRVPEVLPICILDTGRRDDILFVCGMSGTRMLEVGCGSNPLVAFAALRHCRMAAASDGSPEALALMEANVGLNAR